MDEICSKVVVQSCIIHKMCPISASENYKFDKHTSYCLGLLDQQNDRLECNMTLLKKNHIMV